jgi:phospholipid/cholesterol/gamma-HCH transport system substrate-binding protein
MKTAQNVHVGLFVVITALLLVVVLATFAGIRFWDRRDHYRVELVGSVLGLERGALVYLNGTKVGTVEELAPSPKDLRNVEALIALDRGTPIHANTRATLQLAGITGLKVIDLRNGTTDSPRLPVGSTIVEGETVLDRLENRAETIADRVAELLERANRLAQQLDGMDTVVDRARVAATNLADASSSLKSLVNENRSQLRLSLRAIEHTADSASSVLDGQVSTLIANADDFITGLKGVVHRNDSAIRTAVFDLRQASRTFKDLAREVRQRPSRLLFSKPAPERDLP